MTLAMAKTTRATMAQRVKRRMSCSSRIRRVFCRWAASRKRIAAQTTILKRRRLSRWMMIGTETAAAPAANVVVHREKNAKIMSVVSSQ
jgi:hypothetical protein